MSTCSDDAARVLITGVTGMIGSNVAAELLGSRGVGPLALPSVTLFGLARFRSDMRMLKALVPQENAITILRGDLNDPLSVSEAVNAARPSVVYHFAAQGALALHASHTSHPSPHCRTAVARAWQRTMASAGVRQR